MAHRVMSVDEKATSRIELVALWVVMSTTPRMMSRAKGIKR
jgi:hypothetical protein